MSEAIRFGRLGRFALIGGIVLVAQVDRISEVLGWSPRYNDLHAIVVTRSIGSGVSSSVACLF
jgi:hypothetical protein